MERKKQLCKLCGKHCFNKQTSASNCKDCEPIASIVTVDRNNLNLRLKRKFPNKKVKFKLYIEKIEDNYVA